MRAPPSCSGSDVVAADAWHHRSDAISSAAAFLGVGVAVLGGASWYWADEAAAVIAGLLIAYNGARILRPALHDLMYGAPDAELVHRVRAVAERFGLAIDPLARSSMADDLAVGRRTEIDWINGEVVGLAQRLGRQAPVNARLTAIVHMAEKQKAPPRWSGEALLAELREGASPP